MGLFKKISRKFSRDDVLTLSAALSFYVVLALAPLLLVILSVIGLLNISSIDEVISQIVSFTGPSVGEILRVFISDSSSSNRISLISLTIGTIISLVSASAILVQVNFSLNKIFKSEVDETLKKKIVKRISLMIFLFLLLMIIITSLSISSYFNIGYNLSGILIDQLISFLIFTGVFYLLYKYVPDRGFSNKNLLKGAVVSSILFVVGKYLISFYLSFSATSNSYGLAGAFIAFLIWVYFSSIVFFFGAEVIYVSSRP